MFYFLKIKFNLYENLIKYFNPFKKSKRNNLKQNIKNKTKFTWKCKGPPRANTILKKNNRVGENRLERSEINPNVYVLVTLGCHNKKFTD